ncbi:hypothetical protein [Paraburkholderia tropica]|uniref:hypothetical protein n=1 Tax=Paraburkholderia tropica TaxID=92647 RepID=UPI00161677C3|nr:hypothetical protein [Paraburkholderia tropica]MBB6319258.1 hypothetical protein [Paraburkholderia tropica]
MSRSSFAVKLDTTQFEAVVDDSVRNRMPNLMAKALNATARQAQAALKTSMPTYFDRPTPWTLNSTRVVTASPTKLVATVGFKDEAFKGTPATKYLLPQVDGGGRNVKRMEAALRRIGLMRGDQFAMPGRGATLDAYGNVARSQVVQVMSYLQAFGEQGYRANMTQKRRDALARGRKGSIGFSYFALVNREGKLPPGIYKRTNYGWDARVSHLQYGGAKPVFVFTRAPQYQPRFPFDQIVSDSVSATMGANISGAFQLAFGRR